MTTTALARRDCGSYDNLKILARCPASTADGAEDGRPATEVDVRRKAEVELMLSFLFWNLQEQAQCIPCLARLAVAYPVDLFLLAECPKNLAEAVVRLNLLQRGS